MWKASRDKDPNIIFLTKTSAFLKRAIVISENAASVKYANFLDRVKFL